MPFVSGGFGDNDCPALRLQWTRYPSQVAWGLVRRGARHRPRMEAMFEDVCPLKTTLTAWPKIFRIVSNRLVKSNYPAKQSKKSLRWALTILKARGIGALIWSRGAPVGISCKYRGESRSESINAFRCPTTLKGLSLRARMRAQWDFLILVKSLNRKNGACCTKMTSVFFSYGNGLKLGANNVNQSALSAPALVSRLQSNGAFLGFVRRTTRQMLGITRQVLPSYPITLSNNDPSVGLRLLACAIASADGQTRTQSMRSSC